MEKSKKEQEKKQEYSHWPKKTTFKTLADKHKKIRQDEYRYLKMFSLL